MHDGVGMTRQSIVERLRSDGFDLSAEAVA